MWLLFLYDKQTIVYLAAGLEHDTACVDTIGINGEGKETESENLVELDHSEEQKTIRLWGR